MSFTLIKVIPKSVLAIGDDGKNQASNLFDGSMDNKWSYKGKMAWNIITLNDRAAIDSITIYWYMKKKENRKYEFSIYTSENEITIAKGFEESRLAIQKLYDDPATIKYLNNGNGNETSVIPLNNKICRTIIIIYTKSSAKKNWFSVNEIEIMASEESIAAECPDGKKYDPISAECVPIVSDDDIEHIDSNGLKFWEDEDIEYISENHTFSRNFKKDGSMRIDIHRYDMGGKYRPDKECVIFLKCLPSKETEMISFKSDGGPHDPNNPDLGRCEDFGIQFDAKKCIFKQEIRHDSEDGVYLERKVVDVSNMNLPTIYNNWYGLMWRDRRVLREDDNTLLGRILEIKVNPNPFAPNRNIINDNWLDATAFLDSGQYKDLNDTPFAIIDGPVDKTKHQDTIRVDGKNASAYQWRYFRYCGIEPIIVKDENEMNKVFHEIRSGEDIEEPENEAPVIKLKESQIMVTQEGQDVSLDASESTDPEGTELKYSWKQMTGTAIDVPPAALSSSSFSIDWKSDYATSDWMITAMDAEGKTASATVKIINAINQNPEDRKYIAKVYNDSVEGQDKYFKQELDSHLFKSEKSYKNVELTIITTFTNDLNLTLRGEYVIILQPNGNYVISQKQRTTLNYLSSVPKLKGKEIGLKFCLQSTQITEKDNIVLLQVYMSFEKDSKHYAPWFSVVFEDEKEIFENEAPIEATLPADKSIIEIREIQPLPEVSNI